MPSISSIKQANLLLKGLKNSHVIKAKRCLSSLFHMYISAENRENERTELWYLNSRYGCWEFRGQNDEYIVSELSPSHDIDRFFSENDSFLILDIGIVEDYGLEINFQNGMSVTLISNREENLSKKHLIWLLEMPGKDSISMNSDLEVVYFEKNEDAYENT